MQNSSASPEDPRFVATLELEQALESAHDGPSVLQVLRRASLAAVEGINLAGKGLQPQDARLLASLLRPAKCLRVLVLSYNPVGDAGASAVAELLAAGLPLEMISLDQTGITATGAAILAKRLRSSTVVGLSADENSLGPAGLATLVPGLPRTLRFLSLSQVGAEAAGAGTLTSALTGLPLEQLALRYNQLGDVAGAALVHALPRTMRELDLSGNGLGVQTARALSKLLRHGALTVLLLQFNDLTDQGCAALATGLVTPALRVLNLADNNLQAAAAESLAAVLPRTGIHLLEVSHNPFGNGARALLTALGQSQVESLSASGSLLVPEHAEFLGNSLAAGRLQAVDVADNDLGDAVCQAVAAALPHSRVTALRLDSNGITGAGAQRLASALAAQGKKCRLRLLSLADNVIDDAGALALARAVFPVPEATCNLEGNLLSADGIAEMEALARALDAE